MEISEFKAAVNYFGEKNIIGIGFDNTAGNTFTDENPFSMSRNFIENIGALVFIDYDTYGNIFHTVKPVATVQSLAIKDNSVPSLNSYDRHSIRG